MPFQNRINLYNPLAVEGDFASSNPRASVLAGEGGLVAGPAGLTVARFGWIQPSTVADSNGQIVTNYGQGAVAPAGFIPRKQGAALITTYLAEYSNLIPQGFGVTLHNEGDFWAKVNGNAAVIGSTVYARYSDGAVFIGAAPTGAAFTGAIGSTFTATATGASLAVTAVTGLISIGDTIAGTGVPTGTTIIAQVSGTTGGAGTYTTSVATTATAATVTSFGNVINVTAVSSGVLAVGDAVSGTGIPSGSTIASQVSGATGGVGVYTLNVPATAYAASTSVTVVGGIITPFVCASVAAVGEIVKISTWGVQ